MKPTVRWAIAVTSDTDRRVRRVLEATGRKGDLSRFVEETLKAKLLELSMQSLPGQSCSSANDVHVPKLKGEDLDRLYGG